MLLYRRKLAASRLFETNTHGMQVICGQADYKEKPYEWVYDGLKPLLLDGVLEMNKGVHISLAALYCAVGRRLSCSLMPAIATRTGIPWPLAFALLPAFGINKIPAAVNAICNGMIATSAARTRDE